MTDQTLQLPPPAKAARPRRRGGRIPRAAEQTGAATAVTAPAHGWPLAGPPVDSSFEPDPVGYTASFTVLDRMLNAGIGRLTFGLSPRAMASAYLDWASGVAFSPGKQAQLVHKAQRKWLRFLTHVQACLTDPQTADTCCIEPLPQDQRFRDRAWRGMPFSMMYQGFLLTQQWWHNATTGVSGLTPQNERATQFAARQILDVFSPSNFLLTNPVVLDATMRQGGQNLYRGWVHFLEDVQAEIAGRGPVGADEFRVGREVAATPGKIVYRNRLIELIQYAPTTEAVRREPVLITPAWIMKYYILDLQPHNSLVRYLVDRGHSVFMISWKNPDEKDRDLGMDDYRVLGPMAAFDVVSKICPGAKIHAVGYCLGGTLLAIAAAAMARDGDDRLQSLSFLAAQVDFEDAGELMLFINEKQVAFLDDMMWQQGFLDSHQMAGAFQLLRSNDLVWSRIVNEYLMGERAPINGLGAWNADGTRMPYAMHSEYLNRLFLRNDFAEGRYEVDGQTVNLRDIAAPLFVVGTQTDHIAPWRSTYKFHNFTNGELTYLLTNGGHNAGIVADPRDKWRSYQVATCLPGARHADAERWVQRTPVRQGSWWPEWLGWLDARSSPEMHPPPPLGVPGEDQIGDAPGTYVFMR